jgi:hypothetical protein
MKMRLSQLCKQHFRGASHPEQVIPSHSEQHTSSTIADTDAAHEVWVILIRIRHCSGEHVKRKSIAAIFGAVTTSANALNSVAQSVDNLATVAVIETNILKNEAQANSAAADLRAEANLIEVTKELKLIPVQSTSAKS